MAEYFGGLARNVNVGPNNVPAGYWADMIQIGLANTVHGTEELFCNGDVANCQDKQEFPGPGSTTVLSWDDVSKMQRDTIANTWSGKWFRGGELGYLINNPYFWSGESNRNNPIGMSLGISPKQHAVIRPVIEDAFGVGAPGSAKLRQSTSTIRTVFSNYLASKNYLTGDDTNAMVYIANHKLVFDRTPPAEEVERFLAVQSAMNIQSLISQILPAAIYDMAFKSTRDDYTSFFDMFLPLVQKNYGGQVSGKDCSPARDCVLTLTQSILDGFMFAGGLSVPTDMKIALGMLFSEHATNPFPQREIPAGKELNYFWETIRMFAPVMGFPHWEKRPTCIGKSDAETAALNKPNGQTDPCPLGETNSQTGYPEMNQYTGGERVLPHLLLAQRDPKRWGPDASEFVLRDLSEYIKNSLGFADHAYDNSIEGGNHNMYCPGKDMTLVMGEVFFKEFKKSEWVANAPAEIEFKGSPTWITEVAIRRVGQPAPARNDGLCTQKVSKRAFATEGRAFCNADQVPAGKRAPAKIQGLFWLKDLPLPDVAACFSAGEWDADTLTLTLPVLENFYYGGESDSFVKLLRTIKLYYVVTFTDASLNSATLEAYSSADGGVGGAVALLYRTVMAFEMLELPANQPGDKWDRPSKTNFADGIINRYELWRILDANLKVNSENNAAMLNEEASEYFYRYWESQDGRC